MCDKKQPGVTIPIQTIREIMCLIYSEDHELIFHGSGNSYIEDSAGKLVEFFTNDVELFTWCNEQQEILHECRKEAYKQQGYIEN